MANTKEPVANVGDSIARPDSPVGNDDLNRISGFQVAASYNWLEKKNPTIMVPGKDQDSLNFILIQELY